MWHRDALSSASIGQKDVGKSNFQLWKQIFSQPRKPKSSKVIMLPAAAARTTHHLALSSNRVPIYSLWQIWTVCIALIFL